MRRGITNTVSNLRRIQNSVYSSGKIVLAINAAGEKGSELYMILPQRHEIHAVLLGSHVPFVIPLRSAGHCRTVCRGGNCVIFLVCIDVCIY